MTFWKENRVTLILMTITGILLAATGIYTGQAFFRMLPLFNSLFIALLQSRANRIAPLLGGLNCFIYGAVYLHYTLYGSALYVLLVAGPVQILTFFRWRKRPYAHSTVLKRMQTKTRLISGAAALLAYGVFFLLLRHFGSAYLLLDNTLTIIGVFISFLTMFAYVEYTFLNVISTFLNIILYIKMLGAYPEQITFLIFYLYSFFCAVRAFFFVGRLYRLQNKA